MFLTFGTVACVWEVVRRDGFVVALRRLLWFGHISVLHCSCALPKISTQTLRVLWGAPQGNSAKRNNMSDAQEKKATAYLPLVARRGRLHSFSWAARLLMRWKYTQCECICCWALGQVKLMPGCMHAYLLPRLCHLVLVWCCKRQTHFYLETHSQI